MKLKFYFITNIIAIGVILIMYKIDTNSVNLKILNDYIDFSHYELCNKEDVYNRPEVISDLLKYDEDFMANYIDNINLEIKSYSDVEEFINHEKVEGQSYLSSYINRNLWKYIEYAIRDDETLQDYWKIKYYCIKNIGTYNTLIMTQYLYEDFLYSNRGIITTVCIWYLFFTNTYLILKLFLLKYKEK